MAPRRSGTTASPWVLAEVKLGSSFTLRGGAGIHRQVPGFEETFGLRQGPALVPERAIHTDVGIEQTVGADARWQVTFYNRARARRPAAAGERAALVDGRVVLPSPSDRWENSLDGYARGVEMLFQRRSTSGLSGWVWYSLGFNRYHDRVTGESFDGDFDQRHTFNGYGLYRFNDRYSLAAKLRVGSNMPAVGYWEQQGRPVLRQRHAERAAPAAIRAPRRSPQPGVHPPLEPHLPVRRSAERARPRERPVHPARREPADRSGLRFVRVDDSARAVGRGSRSSSDGARRLKEANELI